ncbi:MAG: SRPBCC domain-containing protein [Actinobacteria bacterium]|nr:SRPBCC domain-containing protein [Actinomycetota bacterium]MBO0836119.1 SRPBCC domain-containing protein [Actinomycetota bacterium]
MSEVDSIDVLGRRPVEEVFELPPGSTQVEFTLTTTAAGTRIRVVHRGLPREQASIQASAWQHFLGRLTLAAGGVEPGPEKWGRN